MKNFIKFSPEYNNSKIKIEDLTNGRQFLADNQVISKIILENGRSNILNNYFLNEKDEDDIYFDSEHWVKRNWGLSLLYYLSSRNVKYFDTDENVMKKREICLKKYLKQSICPSKYGPTGEVFILPAANKVDLSISQYKELALQRRTKRSFSGVNCSLQELSDLLFNGLLCIRKIREANTKTKEVLNYCNSYAIGFDFYIVIFNVEGIKPGIYYYNLIQHSLILVEEKCFREEICNILQGMQAPKSANLTILFIGDLMQYAWRYRHEKSLMTLYIQAGQICHDVIIAGLSLKLQSLCTPATKDTILNEYLKLNKYLFTPIYTLTLGK